MTDREKMLEEILEKLLSVHFYGTELYWNYRDGASIHNTDIELYVKICAAMPDVILGQTK